MSLKRLIKTVLIYVVGANSIALIVILAEFIYHHTYESVKSYKAFVLDAMSGSPDHLAHFKATDDYKKLINARQSTVSVIIGIYTSILNRIIQNSFF